MSIWYAVASFVLTVAGSIVQSNAQKAAASRTKAAIRKQDESQDVFRQKASSLIRTTSDKMDPNLRMQTREKRDVANLKKYFQVYDKNRDIREASVFGGGNVFETERYSEGADEARQARDVRNMNAAAQFFSPYQASNIDETRMINNMANSLNTNRNFAGGQFNVDQQAIERAKEVNQNAMMMGEILKGLGMAAGMYGMYSAGTAAATNAATKAAAGKVTEQMATRTAAHAAQTGSTALASRTAPLLSSAQMLGPVNIAATAPSASLQALGYAPQAASSATGNITGQAVGNAFSSGVGVGSLARPNFAPLNAANRGVQSMFYPQWNTPQWQGSFIR